MCKAERKYALSNGVSSSSTELCLEDPKMYKNNNFKNIYICIC